MRPGWRGTASTIRGIVLGSKAPIGTAAAALLGESLAALYVWKVRPWMATWRTEGEEASQHLPGNEQVLKPMLQAANAVTIDAPQEEVWPWLVQMGRARDGFFNFDRLDNEGRRSATTIVLEPQDLLEGDEIPLDRRAAVKVTHLDPPRATVSAVLGADVQLGLIATGSMAHILEGSRAVERAS